MKIDKEDIGHLFEHGFCRGSKMLSLMYEELDDEVSAKVSKGLHILGVQTMKGDDRPLTVILNSGGGSWTAGMAIFDMVRTFPGAVDIMLIGQGCSMGSILLQAGDSRVVSTNSLYMIHDGWTEVGGTPRSVKNWAEIEAKAVQPTMYEIYLECFRGAKDLASLSNVLNKKLPEGAPKVYPSRGVNLGHVRALCSADTWFTAEEMIVCNLADRII